MKLIVTAHGPGASAFLDELEEVIDDVFDRHKECAVMTMRPDERLPGSQKCARCGKPVAGGPFPGVVYCSILCAD